MTNIKSWFGNDSHYIGKLNKIRDFITQFWQDQTQNPYNLLYNSSHCKAIEMKVYTIFKVPNVFDNEQERFCLLASAWIYSTGLNSNLKKTAKLSKLGFKHWENSGRFLDKYKDKLHLDDSELRIIKYICRYYVVFDEYPSENERLYQSRVKFLTACLSLAILLQYTKIKEQNQDFSIIIPHSDIAFLWLKNHFISHNKGNETFVIRDIFQPEEKNYSEKIRSYLNGYFNENLSMIKETLMDNGITHIRKTYVKLQTKNSNDNKPRTIAKLISRMILHTSASASGLSTTVIENLEYLTTLTFTTELLSIIKDYKDIVLGRLIYNRPCHIILKKTNDLVDRVLEKYEDNMTEKAIIELRENINEYKNSRKNIINRLINNAKPLVSDKGSIVLFGYSKTIIDILDELSDDCKNHTKIYVCACGSKTHFNRVGELIYSDGARYSEELKECGFENIKIIPDNAISNLMSHGKIKKVLFGANGVDKLKGSFGHTSGHLTISDVAWVYKIPIYVIADSWKFGELKGNKELMRKDIHWLTKRKEEELNSKGIGLYNPREDIVSVDERFEKEVRIYLIVTDKGIFPVNQIPEDIEENFSFLK